MVGSTKANGSRTSKSEKAMVYVSIWMEMCSTKATGRVTSGIARVESFGHQLEHMKESLRTTESMVTGNTSTQMATTLSEGWTRTQGTGKEHMNMQMGHNTKANSSEASAMEKAPTFMLTAQVTRGTGSTVSDREKVFSPGLMRFACTREAGTTTLEKAMEP